ncbi:hypothetical protein NQ314_016016 [Rhamnusium bicolor]|uniref:Uncharacterized protein n=1 Tax=Rhamnusium bicolor TaxID=1586634 RepID=A0AAV8WYC5_9CUCU|nr:hypothetical protein NQ314_016016 [Rhamnusium bicolor]
MKYVLFLILLKSCGDNGVRYVQLKQEGKACFVRGKITPEYIINNVGYTVEVVVNENEEQVLFCECKNCSASEGKE